MKYAKSWELYKRIQYQVAMPLAVFWFIEFGLVFLGRTSSLSSFFYQISRLKNRPLRIWSIWSLAQGFEADEADWRVPHLKNYWNLVVRLSWFVGGSPWFGAGCWITALLPWGSIYYAWKMNDLSKRLIFKNPSTRRHFS